MSVRLKVRIDTDLVQEEITVECRKADGEDDSDKHELNVNDLRKLVHERYNLVRCLRPAPTQLPSTHSCVPVARTACARVRAASSLLVVVVRVDERRHVGLDVAGDTAGER